MWKYLFLAMIMISILCAPVNKTENNLNSDPNFLDYKSIHEIAVTPGQTFQFTINFNVKVLKTGATLTQYVIWIYDSSNTLLTAGAPGVPAFHNVPATISDPGTPEVLTWDTTSLPAAGNYYFLVRSFGHIDYVVPYELTTE